MATSAQVEFAPRVAGIVVLACTVAFYLGWSVGALMQPGLSFFRDGESSIAASGAAHPWVTITGDTLLGVSLLALAVGLRQLLNGRRGRLAATVLVVAGLATIVQAVVREDCVEALGLCAAPGAVRSSWHQVVHDGANLVAFGGMLAGAFVCGPAFRRDGQVRLATYSTVTWVGGLVCLVVFIAVTDSSIGGLAEFVFLLVPNSWVIVIGWTLLAANDETLRARELRTG